VTLPAPPILVITDRAQCSEPLESRARALFAGGCRWLSLREKDLPAEDRLRLLERLVAIGGGFGAVVGVHDDSAAALACRSALHLPAAGDVAAARRLLGPGILIGRSCHDAADVAAAAAGGADYATLSPVFESASKPGYRNLGGLEALATIAAGARLPVLALGGVTEATLPTLAGTGFAGVAIMGEAMRVPDPANWFVRIAVAAKI